MNNNIDYEIAITREMIQEAASLASDSLLYTTSYVDIFQTSDVLIRKKYLQSLFNETCTIIFNRSPDSFYGAVDKSTGKLICFYMLVSNNNHFTLFDKLYGAIVLPYYIGINNFIRVLKAADRYENKEKSLMNAYNCNEYLALNRMVVHKDYQGKGIGSKCLSIGLKKADQLNQIVFLSTEDIRNVTFYKRLGFELQEIEEFTTAATPYKSWFMIRKPS